jgi:hypothetical protein
LGPKQTIGRSKAEKKELVSRGLRGSIELRVRVSADRERADRFIVNAKIGAS